MWPGTFKSTLKGKVLPEPISSTERLEKMPLHPITLSFKGQDGQLEAAFLHNYYRATLKHVRAVLLLAIFFYGIFGLLDAVLVGDKKVPLWIIRYAVVCPVLLGAFFFTFLPAFEKYMQPVFLVIIIIGGLGVIGMILIAPAPASFSYYAGLILILIFGYTFLRARFVWATAAGWTLVVCYEIAATWLKTPLPVLINNNFFFISANIIGMFACYSIEYYSRRNFYMQRLLEVEQKKVIDINQVLEDRVRQRTHQLVEANEDLKREMAAKQKAQTEKLELQFQLQQSQKMEAIGTLAGGIAHDFNNILAAILGYSEITLLKLSAKNTEETRENLEKILKASQRARDLVNQILTFSRQKRQHVRNIPMGPVAKEVLALLRASLPRNIEIRQKIAADLRNIRADPTQIHQIIMNLCTNAAHAMEGKGGILTVTIENERITGNEKLYRSMLTPGMYVKLVVADNGEGIPEKIINRIFDPYFTTKKPGKGSGMGLAVIQGIVESYGGTVAVESRPGEGAVFEVLFPAGKDRVLPQADLEQIPSSANARILFVDDEDFLVDLTSQMLEQLGYQVVSTNSSRQALEIFQKNPFEVDLLITDMTMPYMTGARLAREVLKIRPDLPVIICTGFNEKISPDWAREMGLKGFLMKPFSINDIAKAVEQALNGRSKATHTTDSPQGGN